MTPEEVRDHRRVEIKPEAEVDRRSPDVRAIDEHRRRVAWSNPLAVWGDQ